MIRRIIMAKEGFWYHVWTIFKFCLVGGCAASVHLALEYIFVSKAGLAPLRANIFSFCIAFFVSYFGHRYITFLNKTRLRHHQAMWRFLCVAVAGFTLNQSLFYLFFVMLHVHYLWALFFVLCITPVITFVLSKWWVFRHREGIL